MQPDFQVSDGAYLFSPHQPADRLSAVREEMHYLNRVGKSFVAAVDRFQVHRALLAALQELYSFSACCILLKGDSPELVIMPCQPLSAAFIKEMAERVANAANVIDFPDVTAEQLLKTAYFDAPDEVAQYRTQEAIDSTEIGSILNIPLTVESRIIGILSLFDEVIGSFDEKLLQTTTMIADYAAVALENVRLRESENALWRQAELERRRLELIIRSMAEGLLITNERGIVSSINQVAQQLFIQARVDLKVGVALKDQEVVQDVIWLQRLSDLVEHALGGVTITNQEMTIEAGEDVVPLALSVSAAPLPDLSGVGGNPLGAVVVLNDVTSVKQVEKLKDEFVSVVSHELRTPLTAIKGYVQHLVRRIERRLRRMRETQAVLVELPEQYDLRSLNIIQSQTEHLERLVSDLLDVSDVQWGQLTLQYSTFYLADVLAECVRSAQASAEQHTIYLDIQTRDSRMVADHERVAQVVGNILDNAIKYSPQGGQVVVSLQDYEDGYQVQVSDQGIGVGPDLYDHIFERFYRVRNRASRQYAGVGLGLFVAKAIVERHGGRIWFTSKQGSGTTFSFTLPRTPRTRPLIFSADS